MHIAMKSFEWLPVALNWGKKKTGSIPVFF